VKKAIGGVLKISFQMNVEDILARKARRHLPKEPTESIICLNMKIRVLKPLIT
jgi:hypothetical protein